MHPEAPPEARLAFFEESRSRAPYLGISIDEGRFVVATGDPHMGPSLFTKQGRPEFRVLQRAVALVEMLCGEDAVAGRLFVDVGANIGTSTVAALNMHRFGAGVSCEPVEENHRLLRANLALNDLDAHVRALRVGVSNRVGRATLVVIGGPSGKAQVALDPARVSQKQANRRALVAADPDVELSDLKVTEVELVTLDRLVQTGIVDPDRAGMLWIDAEGHEGHVLDGGGTLADTGVPVVLEFHPAGLDEHGGTSLLHDVARQCYTHFVDVRRRPVDRGEPRFGLQPVTELPSYGKRFRDSPPPGFTDLLLLRLDGRQAAGAGTTPGESREERLIAFVHIPKTAGGTVTSMLAASWPRGAVRNAGNYVTGPERSARKISGKAWERWLREGGRMTVGHVPYGMFHEHLPAYTRYVTFLREPVERVLSHYDRHVHRRAGLAKGGSGTRVTADSLEQALVEMALPQLNNLATRFLCGHPAPMGDLPASALEDAKANLREFALVGIQERFEESAVLLQRTLGVDLVASPNQHVSLGRPGAEDITDAQRRLIEEHNRLDAELYAFGLALFEEAVPAGDPDFAAEVERLRSETTAANEEYAAALKQAREWLDGELPVGATKTEDVLYAAGKAAGIPSPLVKGARHYLNVEKKLHDDGTRTWTRLP